MSGGHPGRLCLPSLSPAPGLPLLCPHPQRALQQPLPAQRTGAVPGGPRGRARTRPGNWQRTKVKAESRGPGTAGPSSVPPQSCLADDSRRTDCLYSAPDRGAYLSGAVRQGFKRRTCMPASKAPILKAPGHTWSGRALSTPLTTTRLLSELPVDTGEKAS